MIFFFYHVVSYVALVFSFLFNGLLIFLIRRHTIAETRTYAEILLSTCVVDILFITVHVSIQPIYVFAGVYRYILYAGHFVDPVVELAPRFMSAEVLCNLWIFLLFASPTTLSVQFIFRYLVMCRGKIISTQRFFVILGIVSLWMIVLLVILETAQRDNIKFKFISPLQQVLQNFSSTFDEPRDRLKVCWMMSANSKWVPIIISYIGVCAMSMYTMMIMCGWRIWKMMHESMRWTETNSETSKSRNDNVEKWASGNGRSTFGGIGDSRGNSARSSSMRQLANTLILQGSLPFLILLAPNAIFLVQTVDEELAKRLSVWINLSYSFPPVIDPLITIFVVKSYRQALLRLLRIKRSGQPQKVTVLQSPMSSPFTTGL